MSQLPSLPPHPNSPAPRPGESFAREVRSPLGQMPWTLQQFFKGQIDLDGELARRYPNMPLLSVARFRPLGANSDRAVATLAASDGAAQLLLDVNATTRELQLSYTLGSMLSLRFRLAGLSDMDRARWLDLMQRKHGGLAFLWGQARWNSDYVICVLRRHAISLLAFSPQQFEAAARLTPQASAQVVTWLEGLWRPRDHVPAVHTTPPPADMPPATLPPVPDAPPVAPPLADSW